MDIRDCPVCGLPADADGGTTYPSTDGPVMVTRFVCVARHIVDLVTDADAVD